MAAEAAKLAAKIATFAFLVPGVIAFIYFGLSFYRYIQTLDKVSEKSWFSENWPTMQRKPVPLRSSNF